MEAADFFTSLERPQPGTGLAGPLLALWHDARGDWDRAHAIVQADASARAAHVHAYLHRKEGDLANAAYWYRRAGVEPAPCPLDAEWRNLVVALLDQGAGDAAADE